jgi:hypothetical protein
MGKIKHYHYSKDDIELTVNGVNYTVDVTRATATGWYTPATRVDPEENDFEIDNIEAIWYNEEGDVVEETDEMDEALTEYLNDEEWESDDYDDEPPDDYYEERAMARWERQLDKYDL